MDALFLLYQWKTFALWHRFLPISQNKGGLENSRPPEYEAKTGLQGMKMPTTCHLEGKKGLVWQNCCGNCLCTYKTLYFWRSQSLKTKSTGFT